MHKLGFFIILQTSIIFGIDLHFLRNIKYHQEVWENLSVEILWKCLTTGHLVRLRLCPAAGHLDIASAVFDNLQGLCVFFFKKSTTWIKGPLPGLPCVTCLAQFEDNLKLHSVVCCFLSLIERILIYQRNREQVPGNLRIASKFWLVLLC